MKRVFEQMAVLRGSSNAELLNLNATRHPKRQRDSTSRGRASARWPRTTVLYCTAILATMAILPTVASAQQMAAISDSTGEHVFYVDQGGHFLELSWNVLDPISSATSWSAQDLTSITGATGGGWLSGFADMAGEHVFYMGPAPSFHICQLYLPWGGTWTSQDLTELSKATNVASQFFGASASFSDSTGEHVFYVGSNLHIYQLYSPGVSGRWENQDWTGTGGGPPDEDGHLAAFADETGEHVFYMDDNLRQVHQLYLVWGGSHPVDQDLTSQSGGPASISSGLTAFSDNWGEHVIYPAFVGGVVHIDQLYYVFPSSAGEKWVNQDLTAWQDSPLALDGTPLTSFTDVMAETVYYLEMNSHVNQLFARTGWTDEDLTKWSSASTSAFTECPGWFTSISDESGDHVFYVGSSDENLHMLYRNGGSAGWTNKAGTGWVDRNVTASQPASFQPFAAACLFQ
jgi:hypothetical protein